MSDLLIAVDPKKPPVGEPPTDEPIEPDLGDDEEEEEDGVEPGYPEDEDEVD